jgi:APA family basic amino acid/polyamine antiporter
MGEDDNNSDEGLIRTIGPKALGTNIFNMVVGAGIFVLPGYVAAQLGAAALFAYFICAGAVALIFLCYAEIGSRITRSGGSYAYIEDAFGTFPGFIASTLLWFGWAVFSDAALTIAMVDTITIAVPLLNDPVWRAVFIIALLSFMAFTNVIGVKSGIRFAIFNTAIKIIPLALLLVVGLTMIKFENLAITEIPSLENIGAGTLLLIFAFCGAETALNTSGEFHRPSRTVPAGILLGMGSIFIVYLGLQTVAQGVLGDGLAQNTEAPLAAAAEIVFGEWGGTLLLAGAAISIFGTLSGDILATPRVIFAAARDDNLPGILSKVHPVYKTPHVAIMLYAFAIGAIALSGSFQTLAVLASGSILLVYAGVCAAALKVRLRDGDPGEGEFKMPGKTIIPILGCSVIAWMLYQMSGKEWMGLIIFLIISTVLYFLQKFIKNRSG